MHAEYKITIKENGRFVLPIKVREKLGITAGDQLLLVLDKDIRIIPLKESLHRFQQRVKSCNKQNISLVDSLKKTRLAEFDNE